MVRGDRQHGRRVQQTTVTRTTPRRTVVRQTTVTSTRGTTLAAVRHNHDSAEAAPRANRGSKTRTERSTTVRESSRANLGSGTTATVRTTTPRANHRSGTKRDTDAVATTRVRATPRVSHERGIKRDASAAAARTTPRANHGSGTKRDASAAAARTTPRANHGITTVRESSRTNHGSSTRSNTTASTTVGTTQRANHGSGTRGTAFATTTTPHRANHGTRHHRSVREVSRARSGRRNDPPTGIHNHDPPNEWWLCCVCRCIFECLGAILLAVVCCGSCVDESATTASTTIQSHRHRHRGWVKQCWCSIPLGLCGSALVLVALVQFSKLPSYLTIGSTKTIEAMFAGETRKILPPRFSRELTVSVSEISPGVRLNVYSTTKCPSLNGPRLKLHHDSELDLDANEFSKEYYNFNPGSYVEGRIDGISGVTNLYILKGEQVLNEIRNGTNLNPQHWEDIAVAKCHVKTNRTCDFFYTTSYWKDVDGGDNIHTFVYDNASSRRESSLDVQTNLTFNTHNLNGYLPTCKKMKHNGASCKMKYPSSQGCIILQAYSVHETDDSGTISLKVESYRDWKRIFFLSVIPLFGITALAYSLLALKSCLTVSHTETNNDEDLVEPLLPPADGELQNNHQNLTTSIQNVQPLLPPDSGNQNLPPPTVPRTPPQPSAPIEEDVFVVPPENVEVVAK